MSLGDARVQSGEIGTYSFLEINISSKDYRSRSYTAEHFF
jgi:hypothetical protein